MEVKFQIPVVRELSLVFVLILTWYLAYIDKISGSRGGSDLSYPFLLSNMAAWKQYPIIPCHPSNKEGIPTSGCILNLKNIRIVISQGFI
jgi:hypothetical protein